MQSAFRDSVAWQKAMNLATAVYDATRTFPREETFGLTNQLRRAAVSIPSNIAEGQGRLTPGEFMHFLGIARGSALEVQTQLELGQRLGFGSSTELEAVRRDSVEVLKILNASIAGMRSKASPRARS